MTFASRQGKHRRGAASRKRRRGDCGGVGCDGDRNAVGNRSINHFHDHRTVLIEPQNDLHIDSACPQHNTDVASEKVVFEPLPTATRIVLH
jgi:hypothetical protein